MTELCAQVGYQNVRIAQVTSRAKVSTATFYEQFADKEGCMLAAYAAVAEHVFGQLGETSDASDWSAAARGALEPLLAALVSHPDAGRLLFIEGTPSGQRLRAQRRQAIGGFERRVQGFLDSPPKDGNTLDLPATAVVGALRSIVANHLHSHTEDLLTSLIDDGLAWVASYAVPATQALWSTGPRAILPQAPEPGPRPHIQLPVLLPPGRHAPSAGALARSQRERILAGTAGVTMAKGYAATTVADIVARARVSRESFYEHFSNKQHAFLEAQQYPTQCVLDACARAYFSVRAWPERIWTGLKTLLHLIAANPAFSHLRLVECYAAGPLAAHRAEEITRSFTFFLEEGYTHRPGASQLPRLCSAAIVGAIFALIQRHVAHEQIEDLPRRLPQIAYVAIAPFTGPNYAIDLLQRLSSRLTYT